MENPLDGPSWLMVVLFNSFGTENYALLDKGAISNIILQDFGEKVTPAAVATHSQVTVADETVAQVSGCVKGFTVSGVSLVVPLGFLVVPNVPLSAIIANSFHYRVPAGESLLWTQPNHHGSWEKECVLTDTSRAPRDPPRTQ